jgi:hypothetical protein
MIALVLELCGGVCALSTIVFLAVLMVSKLMPDLEEELGADLARSQAEGFVAHLEQSGFVIMRSRSQWNTGYPAVPRDGALTRHHHASPFGF